ncbi:MAG: hypothetical protein R3310_16245, partial [Candidatus Competibacteraceae bacterium]|nr:hypothetical protein [Candidatus Competibacteraceae bacterium]
MPDQPTRGGTRPGAGRPAGSGRYGERTRVMRIPVSRIEAIRQWLDRTRDRGGHAVPTPPLDSELAALY